MGGAMQTFDPRLLALRDWLRGQMLAGTQGARYHLRDRIGEGGQGWVFSASWDEPGGYVVIVKVLRPDAVTSESLARFQREAQVLRMLGQASRPNPHIVRYFDHATARLAIGGGPPIELPFTVLEFVRGPTLEHVLGQTRGTGLALERTRRLGRQVALALEDVHAHKIVHRDLKPSNVLLANEGGAEIAKVTDFGLVKLVDIGVGRTTALAGATLGYAPPEQFEQGNLRVNPRTDVFSFAAILYEMLTGTKAFPHGDGENPLIVVTRLLNGPRPSLTHTRGALPPELTTRKDILEKLDAILVRATSAEPSDRHASATELWDAIEPLLRTASERRSFPPPPLGAATLSTPDEPPKMYAAGPRPARDARMPAGLDATSRQSFAPPTEAQLASPAWWKWRVCAAPVRAGAVRAAAFDARGETAIAVGPNGLLHWEGEVWSRLSTAPELDTRIVRGMTWLRSGELVLFGGRGLAARLLLGSGLEAWDLPDREATFLGAHVDLQGTVTLVGERPARHAPRAAGQAMTMGTIAQFARGKLTLLTDAPMCARLRGVTRLLPQTQPGMVGGGAIVACGDWGALVRLELGVPEHLGAICGGHLNAIGALGDGGAVTVGAGGHALSMSPRLEAQLEAVQTTRDLLALAVDSSGVAWAGSAQARVLRRTDGSWVRMSGELGLPSSVVALWAASRMVRAICDDGAVIEGTVAVG
jgi:serine/threonine-protein kinase